MVSTTIDPDSKRERVAQRSVIWRWVWFNLPFVLVLAIPHLLPDAVQALVVGSILFLVPGLAWVDHRNGDAVIVLLRAVTVSTVAALLTWLAVMLPEGLTSRVAFIVLLAVVTNVGLFLGVRRGWYEARPFSVPLSRALIVVAALFYFQSYLGAVYFIPALEDQDMETQGTAYGLMHFGEPAMVTNRNMRFYFAHPLLLHLWIGESAMLSDDLDRLRYYYESTLLIKDAPEKAEDQWELDYQKFLADPVLLPTRTPNLFLSAFTILVLGFLAYGMSGSTLAALGACVLYATLPEIYVRTAYGAYLAVTNYLLLSGVYLYLWGSGLLPHLGRATATPPPKVAGGLTFGASLLGIWADQKAILLPMAASIHAPFRALVGGPLSTLHKRFFKMPEVWLAFLIGIGFLAGVALFFIYGYGIAPFEFHEDFVRGHVIRRLKMTDLNLAQEITDRYAYPSILGLWKQFSMHSGWLFMGLSILGAVHAARKPAQAHGLILLWMLIGAVGFSLVDWRQTKHLAHILPPMALLISVYWATLQGRARTIVGVLAGCAVAWNLWRVGLLMQDFEYLKPLPLW